MMKLKWEKLLNETRIRNLNPTTINQNQKKSYNIFEDHRNEFERDYDRINNSSAVRRLQDKAQVYPLQSNDFIRTRLTHSMEVSSIARSLGIFLERYLSEKKIPGFNEKHIGKIPSILASAALVHDIGNPPFGHYGEDVIKEWFDNKENLYKLNEWVSLCWENDKALPREELWKNSLIEFQSICRDFKSFDGNAQGLRVVNKLQYFKDDFGLNLTAGTLSTLLKYPFESNHHFAETKQKFGYFYSDKKLMEEIKKHTLGSASSNFRNPLTYLLEAADDIAYIGSDVEDGVKKGSILWNEEFILFYENVIKDGFIKVHNEDEKIELKLNEIEIAALKKIKSDHQKFKQDNHPDPMVASARSFKVWSQGILISEVKKVFDENYEQIMNGEFGDFSEIKPRIKSDKDEPEFNHKELIDHSAKASALRKWMKGLLIKYCFVDNEVVTLELVGDRVINDLLDIFLVDCMFKITDKASFKNKKVKKLYSLISSNIKFTNIGNNEIYLAHPYKRVQMVIDFVSGMTDSYALDLHQKLTGVKMP
ncbi:dGTP triphosphohydrolase [Exiguobacterium chiriqhucha]|uniref:dGTP triphosphohydrolase n=1 Tax=Exiguobacterium chiriqhucha TaxID=1385984 RepID=UPI0038BE0BDB